MARGRSLSRRGFLRWAGTACLGAGLSACAKAPAAPAPTAIARPTQAPSATPTIAPTAVPTETVLPAAQARLAGGEADVWAWEAAARGTVGPGRCDGVEVRAGEKSFPADVVQNEFQATVPIGPGENALEAACLPDGPVSEKNMLTGRLRNVPTARIAIQIREGQVLLDGSASQRAPLDPAPLTGFQWTGPGVLESPVEGPTLELTPPAEDGTYFLSLEVTDEAGRVDRAKTYFVVQGGQPLVHDFTWQNADWIESAVVYGVIPRKFGPDGFRSIQARLDALQDLGVDALWLAPINGSPPGDYGYAVTDYFELRESLGTKEDFRALVQAAHERGIRVLMDFVPNHSSAKHPYFLDAQAKGRESRYWDFYDRDADGQPTHYFSWEHLPNLNYNNPEVENWMMEAFSYWVREFDVDGFRVDVAWGIRERKPDFWPRWRAEMKRIKPEVFLIAEASARDEYYFTEGFDAAYDWTDQLGKWAWGLVFEDRTLLLYNLRNALTNGRQGYHEDALIFRFLNNNDTGGRFISLQGVDMAKVATTLLLTLPGIPCIYTGDEIGAEYTPYGDPLPLNWAQDDRGMFDFHKNLIRLRHEVPALHGRGWQLINVDPRPNVMGYLRWQDPAETPVLVLLNFTNEAVQAEVSLPDEFAPKLATAPLRDLLSGETLTLASEKPVMAPMSARILSV